MRIQNLHHAQKPADSHAACRSFCMKRHDLVVHITDRHATEVSAPGASQQPVHSTVMHGQRKSINASTENILDWQGYPREGF